MCNITKLPGCLLLIGCLIWTTEVLSQDSILPSVPKTIAVEELIGHKRQYFQLLVNKRITEMKKFGFLSLTSYAVDYAHEAPKYEYLNASLISFRIVRGLRLHSGVNLTSMDGLTNFVGLHYHFQKGPWSGTVMPSYFFLRGQKVGTMALLEYAPIIHDDWSLYTRVQALYTYDLAGQNHYRSYLYSRLGMTYRILSFGLAHNYDGYGPKIHVQHNLGVFIRLAI